MKRSDAEKLDRKMGGIRFNRSLLHSLKTAVDFNRGNYFPYNTQSFFIKLGTSK